MPKKAPKKEVEKQTPPVTKKKETKVVAKVTAPPKKNLITNTNIRPKEIPIEKIGPSKTKRFGEDKYEKISEKASAEKFREMGQKVQNGTHEWAYFAVENDSGLGYHYYLKKN